MTIRTQHKRSYGLGRIVQTAWRSLLAASLVLSPVANATSAHAAITNTALVSGSTPRGDLIDSNSSTEVVTTIPPTPAMVINKFGVLNDDDGTLGTSAGDTIDYTISVRNTGNVSLTDISVSDPLIALTFSGGDSDGDNELDVGENWIYKGSYTLLQSDLDSNGDGDGDIDNTVTVSSNELPNQSGSEETPISTTASMRATKTATLNDDDGTPGLSTGDTISYFITLENTGVTALTNIRSADTLVQGGSTTILPLSGPIGDLDVDNELDVGETWQYTATYSLSQTNLDDGGDLVNTVTFNSDETAPASDDATTVLDPGGLIPSYIMTKSATLVDGDGDGRGDAGEVINYSFEFTNTGTLTLRNLRVSDPLSGLSAITCGGDLDSDGDIDLLAPSSSQVCTASYTVTSADVDAGSVDNTATSSAQTLSGLPVIEDDSANDNSTTTPTDRIVDLEIVKTASTPVEVFPYVYDFSYVIEVTNTGTVDQTAITLVDDLSAALPSGAVILGAPVVSVSGFGGTGGANAGYNGVGNNDLLSGAVELAPGQAGRVTIGLRVEVNGSTSSLNTAFVDSGQTPSPIASDDPTETPGDDDDTQPTPVIIEDSDGDGSDDDKESNTQDRDDDGIFDSQDYDPTGYLYCEDDGRVLNGGLISVQNLATGGIQTGAGSSNNITIARDGSDGLYQFFVNQTGRYRLIVTPPPSMSLSTVRPPSGTLDVTSLLPNDPGVLGSGANGSPAQLLNFTQGSNPYYFDFDIEAGDPSIFNNNIPFGNCGIPNLLIAKTATNGPDPLPNGNVAITYQVVVENTGTLRAENVQVVDNLATTFGAGNYTIMATSVDAAPAGFTASANPFYDGDGVPQLFTGGGVLQPGESVTASISLETGVPSGVYTNTAIAQGTNPGDASALPEPRATVDVSISTTGTGGNLIVSKTAALDEAAIGDAVPYEIRITNPNSFPIVDVDIVDVMPAGFTYVPGSAVVGGSSVEPAIRGRELIWSGQTAPANSVIIVSVVLRVGAAASGTEFANSVYVRNPRTGEILSNVAKAVVRLEIEPVFQCSDLIGRVFDDLDADGYYDDGEPGLAKVRIATVDGLLVTTDNFGRFHIACGAIPDEKIGSNFIMKLDTRTLPTGYRVTSENPRVVRLTRGKLTKINFAAALLREVKLGLTDNSFVGGTTRLTREALVDIRKLLPILEKDTSKLLILYRSANPRSRLAISRANAVKRLVDAAWKSRSRPYKLEIDLRRVR